MDPNEETFFIPPAAAPLAALASPSPTIASDVTASIRPSKCDAWSNASSACRAIDSTVRTVSAG